MTVMHGEYVRVALSCALGLSVLAQPSSSQATDLILTGDSATARFLYRGKPVHPFCLDFPLERSSRREPISLSSCNDTRIQFQADTGGWRRAQYRPPENTSRNVAYRVLASAGDRFLIASEAWGYGSGQFSNLLWVYLDSSRIAVDRDVAGGDRCAAGLSGYTVDRSAVIFGVSTTARDVVRLAGVRVPDSMRRALRSGYLACDGQATYRYDLASGRRVLSSLTLRTEGAALDVRQEGQPRPGAQVCFDDLVREFVHTGRQKLLPDALKAFGEAFLARCGPSRS
jgi:hypothetical protein